jgi:tRNA threonylcarbamoyladenosine biosynthesis protein TsaE
MNITVNNINELPLISAQMLNYLADYRVILFFAPMGAGKTTLINELCRQLGVTDQPSSPTFSIVNEYQSSNGPIFHFDFYRLKDEREAYDLGYEEYFFSGNYCFVEWPEKIMNLLPSTVISIFISVLEDGTRKIELRKGLQ